MKTQVYLTPEEHASIYEETTRLAPSKKGSHHGVNNVAWVSIYNKKVAVALARKKFLLAERRRKADRAYCRQFV